MKSIILSIVFVANDVTYRIYLLWNLSIMDYGFIIRLHSFIMSTYLFVAYGVICEIYFLWTT